MLVSGAKDPLAEALDTLPGNARLLLAVDQLEELFTACRSDTERAAFADMLARAAADPDGRAVVVVALRADFYGRFAAYPGLAELLGGNQVLVGPMQASELRRAVELPAGRVGLRVEPELADALVDDVEGEPGALPLLSTALLELWQKRQDNALTLSVYGESGGVHGAVARLAEGTYARIPEGASRSCEPSCCAWSARTRATRRCADALHSPSWTWSATGTWPMYLRRWPTVALSLSEKAPLRSPMRRCCANGPACASGSKRPKGVGCAATSPRRRPNGTRQDAIRASSTAAPVSRPPSTRLQTVHSTSTSSSASSSPRAARSRTAKQARRTNRRLRGLLAGVGILLAAALAGGMFAIIQRGDARDAETAQLAQRLGAQSLVEEDLDRSLLLARQAVEIDDSPQTRSYLLSELLRSPAAIGIMHGGGDDLRQIAVSPDGKTLAVGGIGADGLRFFDAETYEQIGEPVEVPAGPRPDGGHGPGVQPRWGNARVRDELRRRRRGLPPGHRREDT